MKRLRPDREVMGLNPASPFFQDNTLFGKLMLIHLSLNRSPSFITSTSLLFSELVLDVEHLEVLADVSRPEADAGASHPMPTSPMIRIERSATVTDEPVVSVVADAKFDPKGKSVASGKSVSGWL